MQSCGSPKELIPYPFMQVCGSGQIKALLYHTMENMASPIIARLRKMCRVSAHASWFYGGANSLKLHGSIILRSCKQRQYILQGLDSALLEP
jgi:hypothetical protein